MYGLLFLMLVGLVNLFGRRLDMAPPGTLNETTSGVRETMRVFTFASGSEDLPPHERAIARIKCPMASGFGKTRAIREEWHPVIIYAATQAEAAAKATSWWNTQVELERAKAANVARRVAAMRERRSLPTNTSDPLSRSGRDE